MTDDATDDNSRRTLPDGDEIPTPSGRYVRVRQMCAPCWEYRYEIASELEEITYTLDDWGRQGWELVSTSDVPNSNEIVVIFRRPLFERVHTKGIINTLDEEGPIKIDEIMPHVNNSLNVIENGLMELEQKGLAEFKRGGWSLTDEGERELEQQREKYGVEKPEENQEEAGQRTMTHITPDDPPAEDDRIVFYEEYDGEQREIRAIVKDVIVPCAHAPDDPETWDVELRYVHDSAEIMDVPENDILCWDDLRRDEWDVIADEEDEDR